MAAKRGTPSEEASLSSRRQCINTEPLLLSWNAMTDNIDNLKAVVDATSWEALFQFNKETAPQDPEGREAAIRYKRNLLLKEAHPDKGPEKDLRHRATTNIHRLFTEAAKTWMPTAVASGPNTPPALPEDAAPAMLHYSKASTPALIGRRVRLHSLSDIALNGQYGELRGVDSERAAVQLDGDGPDQLKSIRNDKLKMVPASFVRGGALELLDGLAAATDDAGNAKTPELIYSAPLRVYTGFAKARVLKSDAKFEAMTANRCVSSEVIATRTAENCRQRRAGSAYCDFGLISLVVVQYSADGGREAQFRDIADPATGQIRRHPMFYVLDGQHRLSTMNALMDPETWVGLAADMRRRFAEDAEQIDFQISVKVVNSHMEANRVLMQMQNCYVPDRRCFFSDDHEANVASGALELAKLAWPRAFVPLDVRGKANKLVPDRPLLDDGCFFDFLRDTKLLQIATSNNVSLCDKPRYLFEHLRLVNKAICQGRAPGKLSQHEFKALEDPRGKTSGCYLGYYRRDQNGAELLKGLHEATDECSTLPAHDNGKRPILPQKAALFED
mmetsp:Transcript_73353/g.122545  ORF Transcript_73353/g.122545 Transcript_73353/m.122545 type:complete len:559 (+) Transcript_73353:196-1872(+)|eukprot:CAMPEP_0119317964 /NCGR_PEP_ID=MMETSP1333-20130426/45067_1 /TAXON_ID=418940 /ORGANISM="Scyphosphaera apsteinii, Strain RCC1455" /LENGTH=558 /DNA_ID=CAMNT_0007324049 /DNA_START=189 /DNA_END=1865 /DNA_ORIENTATION=+